MRYRLIDLIRHGEVEGGRCFRGRRDDPLSAVGWAQLATATGTGGRMQGARDSSALRAISRPIEATTGALPWDRILCSPAARCAHFADRLAADIELPAEQMDSLRERDFGNWEGLRADQIPPQALARFWADPSAYDPPGSEPFVDFRRRVIAGWQRALDGGGNHLLLITHGGVIRVIIGELLGIPNERLILLEVPPACCSRLRVPVGDGLPSLVSHGSGPISATGGSD